MVIKDGVIKFVGSNAGANQVVQNMGAVRCRVIDMAWKKTILPGIHDVHMHPMEVGSSVAGTCMVPKVEPIQNIFSQ